METWHIHIQGQVQGVGFRPFIFRLAQQSGLKGWVNNTLDGVHIRLNTDETTLERICEDIIRQAPVLAKITSLEYKAVKAEAFQDFQIIHSHSNGIPNLAITPDVAICEDCRTEIKEVGNRREGYAFTTCINCGPRYSIMKAVPYDRENTGMASFHMCSACQNEYDNPNDRRYYSQTNSCADCGISLSLWEAGQEQKHLQEPEIIRTVLSAWEEGQIVAIKGIGGYLLTCDASNTEAVQTLRTRKSRPTKPFAMLFPDLQQLKQVTHVHTEAEAALTGPVAPIVLLPVKEDIHVKLALADIAPNLQQIGVMLPYTPLYELLLSRFGKPVVATSGNISNTPIVYRDKNALESLGGVADLILTHNRPIETPQDDSVLTFSPHQQRPIWLRRSRGLAPSYLDTETHWPGTSTLATGAMLKSTFCLLHQRKVFLSQYLGDLGQYETQEHYQATYQHLKSTLSAVPRRILADLHPDYPSTLLAQGLGEQYGIPVELIQHHKAHFGALLGEHHLWQSGAPVLGFIWDGTGMGDDHQIWGGECFLYEDFQFERIAHFEYFSAILGDKMAKEPRISALSASYGLPGAATCLKPLFNNTEWSLYNRMLDREPTLKTSSVGRLFDAVSAILGFASHQSYEGEAAILLEQAARNHITQKGLPKPYPIYWEPGNALPLRPILAQVLTAKTKGIQTGEIAARFHQTLAVLAATVAIKTGVRQIACSGGVFQNGLLVDLLIAALPKGYTPYFHERLSPNDENIAFGQLICHLISTQKAVPHTSLLKNTQPCV